MLWGLLEGGDRPPAAALAWLRRGITRHLRGGSTLDEALALRCDQRRNLNVRDWFILQAGSQLTGTRHDRSRRLAGWAAHPERMRRWSGRAGSSLQIAASFGRLPTSVRSYQRILGHLP